MIERGDVEKIEKVLEIKRSGMSNNLKFRVGSVVDINYVSEVIEDPRTIMDIIRENREEYGCTGKIVEIKDTTLVIDASYLFNEDVREIAIDKIIRITEADKSHVSSLHERGVAYL